MEKNIKIRLARGEDAPAIRRAEAVTATIPGLLVAHPFEIPLDAYGGKIEVLRKKGRYIVAELDGSLVGHAFLDPMSLKARSHVFQLTIVAHPGFTNRGIGRAMMHDLLAWASLDDRVEKIELLVRATNDSAISLYQKCGFVEEGRFRHRIKLDDGTYIDDIAMAWFPSDNGQTKAHG
jgi:ribosomal protein S18 acetylase RimI-like enzyme